MDSQRNLEEGKRLMSDDDLSSSKSDIHVDQGLRRFLSRDGWAQWVQEMRKPKSLLLGVYLLGLVICGALQNVFLVSMSDAVQDFPYSLLIFPILASAGIFFPIVWYRQATGLLSEEGSSWRAKGKILLMGLFDQTADFLVIYGSTVTNPTLVSMYTQLNIPATIGASFIFLGARYRLSHYMGAALVIGGVALVTFAPAESSSDGSAGSVTGSIPAGSGEGPPPFSHGQLLYGHLLFVVQCIPAALAAVVKEWCLAGEGMDIYYINAWESLFQVFLGIIMIPLVLYVPDPANAAILPDLSGLPDYFKNATLCIAAKLPVADYPPCSVPAPAWSMILAFVGFDVVFNIFLLLLVKNGSATLMWLGIALSIPFTSVVSAILMHWNFFDNQPAPASDAFSIPAIIIIILGILIYLLYPDTDLTSGKGARVPMSTMAVYVVPETVETDEIIAPKTVYTIRKGYFGRLGIMSKDPPPPAARAQQQRLLQQPIGSGADDISMTINND
eukprot:TRINITY_DN11300_c0_g1_i1.p1 TRINITY_DN11300_c0_g1~~TRINITY_DN11300_c0_g1_i1.p1  ORF type:complete len:501 (-),score=84.12 TRINITY_DN11300_c0_g1_i1:64-1566(-)